MTPNNINGKVPSRRPHRQKANYQPIAINLNTNFSNINVADEDLISNDAGKCEELENDYLLTCSSVRYNRLLLQTSHHFIFYAIFK